MNQLVSAFRTAAPPPLPGLRSLAVMLAAAVVLLASTAVYLLKRERDLVWSEAMSGSVRLAVSLRSSVSALLAQATVSIAGVAHDLRRGEAATGAALRDAMRFDPLSAYLGVTTSGGRDMALLAAAGRPVDDAIRRAIAAGIGAPPRDGLEVRVPFQLPGDKTWYLPVVAAPAPGADRLVFALVPVHTLMQASRGLHDAEGGIVSLVRADGERLLRYHVASAELQIGGPRIAAANLQRFNASPQGAFRARSNLDRTEAVWGFARAESLPITLVAGLPVHKLEQQWLSQSVAPAVLLGVGALLLAAFAVRLRAALRQQSRAAAQQRHAALHDPLTGLLNREAFVDVLKAEMGRGTATPFAVVLLDLHHFRDVNETLGHQVGDEVLRELAARVRQGAERMLAGAPCVARLGGDQMVVLARGPGSAAQLAAFARELQQVLSTPVNAGGIRMEIRACMGAAVFPTDDTTPSGLLRRAVLALGAAKARLEPFARYVAAMDAVTPELLALKAEFAKAVRDDALTVAYQPKLALASGRVVGCEALARWTRADGTAVSPAVFIPMAENTELMGPLTELILKQSLAQARRWLDGGLHMPVAVNISANSLLDPGFVERVATMVAEAGVPVGLLELEVTESAVMRQPEVMVTRLRQLRELGVTLAIDDFGTGYASLAYLKRLPVHKLKIDKAFILNLCSDAADQRIVHSAIQLAHGFGLEVVAEGVESDDAAALLRQYGCDQAQGYGFARPMPADAVPGFAALE